MLKTCTTNTTKLSIFWSSALNKIIVAFVLVLITTTHHAQLVINEGSNKNYSTLIDEDGDAEDWIEIHNMGSTPVNLLNYSLSDNSTPGEWVFPSLIVPPNGYVVVFCSGKNRYATSPFTTVYTESGFQPQTGANAHPFNTPFFWDGQSNILLNTCTYNPFYTVSSSHYQTPTAYNSSTYSFVDGVSACEFASGNNAQMRPDIQINGLTIGAGTIVNSPYDYPAPYGNWYWSTRHQFLYTASELVAAGLTAGTINSLSFLVQSTNDISYEYLDISIATTGLTTLSSGFIPATGSFNHTNFKISSEGETVRLYDPSNTQISSLNIDCGEGYDVSIGRFPDGSNVIRLFDEPTPIATNNFSNTANAYAQAPTFSVNSSVVNAPVSVTITDPNVMNSTVYYTTDGSTPTVNSDVWDGTPILIFQSTVLRARAFIDGYIPSAITSASYLFNANHSTPIISVVSDPSNIFGPTGMFDNPYSDWLKAASIQYFDSTLNHNLLYSQRAGIIMDGGWGSRGQAQRPFRIKFDHSVVGQGPIIGNIIPDRPERTIFDDFYLRNGSNQFLVLPYKDAAQVKMMADGANGYYAAWRPVSVYINGNYWGLYELREKFDKQKFVIEDNADPNTIEILSASAMYGFVLRAVEGDVQNFYSAYDNFLQISPNNPSFWNQADVYFDMQNYNDYIIGEVWMNNADWGFNYNNLKIYRSDATGFRWRYCLMDMEFGLLPSPAPDLSCNYDLLSQLMNWGDVNNPHLRIFLNGIQNDQFRHYFINRFADQMNSLYLPERLLAIENEMFNQTVAEMANEYQRWADPFNVPGWMNYFYQNHLVFRDELACRPEQARNYIQSNFNLPQQVDVDLDVFPANAGKIKISTITPDNYPWEGVYFDGVPIQIEAIAEPGYVFSHWEANGLITNVLNSVFLDTLNTSEVLFKAYFTSTVGFSELNINAFTIYPNPASDVITIASNANLGELETLKVVDLLGKEHQVSYDASGSMLWVMNVADLSSGYYIVQYVTKDGTTYKAAFVKQ
jgi:hypothetical protein